MFTTGFAIFLSLLFVLAKLKRRLMLRVLHYDVLLDIVVTVFVLFVHWGSIAGLFTSMATTFAKRMFGYVAGGVYYPGRFRLEI
jgi:nucleoside permease NupC